MPKYRKMLNDWDAVHIQAIVHAVEGQSKETLIQWTTDYAERVMLPLWETYCPQDTRPKEAIEAARAWVRKEIKLPAAKAVILQCHNAARDCEGNPAAQAAARAIGQSASTIHAATHCMGLPLYGAVAVGYENAGWDASWDSVHEQAILECARMIKALEEISIPDDPNPAKLNWQC